MSKWSLHTAYSPAVMVRSAPPAVSRISNSAQLGAAEAALVSTRSRQLQYLPAAGVVIGNEKHRPNAIEVQSRLYVAAVVHAELSSDHWIEKPPGHCAGELFRPTTRTSPTSTADANCYLSHSGAPTVGIALLIHESEKLLLNALSAVKVLKELDALGVPPVASEVPAASQNCSSSIATELLGVFVAVTSMRQYVCAAISGLGPEKTSNWYVERESSRGHARRTERPGIEQVDAARRLVPAARHAGAPARAGGRPEVDNGRVADRLRCGRGAICRVIRYCH